MKRLVMMLLALAVIGGTTEMNAQGWLKKLGKKAEDAAKRAVERNVEHKVDKTVDDAFNGNISKKSNNNSGNNSNDNGNYEESDATPQSGGKQQGQSLEMTYAKSDFVPGDESSSRTIRRANSWASSRANGIY